MWALLLVVSCWLIIGCLKYLRISDPTLDRLDFIAVKRITSKPEFVLPPRKIRNICLFVEIMLMWPLYITTR